MTIPENVILLWPGLNAEIPEGWLRETLLDGKYAKAWGVEEPNTTGGAATHTHTSPSHTHAVEAHVHSYTNGAIPSRDTVHTHVGGSATLLQHRHTGNTGAVNTSNNFGSTAVTYGAVSNDPPFYSPIFIKAELGAQLAIDIVALWSGWNGDTDTPDNWENFAAMQGKYLKGAATDANAGATGGSYTNVHDITHTHTGASHNHSGFTTGTANDAGIANTGSCCSVIRSHTHTYSGTDSTTVTPNSYTTPLTTPETVEPEYVKVGAIQRKENGLKVKGLIGLWLGAEDDIPQGWALCEAMKDKFIKITNTPAEYGDTGGSNTHTHAAQSHVHSIPAHSHFVNETKNHQGISLVGINEVNPGNADDTVSDSTHGTFNTDTASVNTTAANTTANSSANQPEYRTAVYIQFQKEINAPFLEAFL